MTNHLVKFFFSNCRAALEKKNKKAEFVFKIPKNSSAFLFFFSRLGFCQVKFLKTSAFYDFFIVHPVKNLPLFKKWSKAFFFTTVSVKVFKKSDLKKIYQKGAQGFFFTSEGFKTFFQLIRDFNTISWYKPIAILIL